MVMAQVVERAAKEDEEGAKTGVVRCIEAEQAKAIDAADAFVTSTNWQFA